MERRNGIRKGWQDSPVPASCDRKLSMRFLFGFAAEAEEAGHCERHSPPVAI